MATSAQSQNKCSKCGRIFDTSQDAKQHEMNCDGKDRVAGNPAAESPEQIKKNMEIEEGFEAEDN